MNDLIVVPQTSHWQKPKALVLNSVSSPITRRVYNLGLDEFFAWLSVQEPRPGFTKATVSAWRGTLATQALGRPARVDLGSARLRRGLDGTEALIEAQALDPLGEDPRQPARLSWIEGSQGGGEPI